MELKRIGYADCYHGLIKLILEKDNIPSCLMNTRSWGIEYRGNEIIDIERSHFNARLERYFNFQVSREIYDTAEEYIERIRYTLRQQRYHTLI